jgi:hypothetical protein
MINQRSLPGPDRPGFRVAAAGSPGLVAFYKLILVLLLFVGLFTGCARSYVITLNNGSRITAQGKPKLSGSTYVYKDASGKPAQVSILRVREIAPASMATEEGSQFMK